MASSRSRSPTTALASLHQDAREKVVQMVSMGLHVFNPEWQQCTRGLPRGRQYSASFKDITLKILGSDEQLTFAVQTCTKVGDVREAIAGALMVDPQEIDFLEKRGCSTRKQMDMEEVARNVVVKGIASFKPMPHKWRHPAAVIGAGYNGLKTLMLYLKAGNTDIVCFDRNEQVGGYCWITAANKTSRLQTEFGSFHVWWGQELVQENCGYPTSRWSTWPHKKEILEHFQFAAEQYGVLPHIRFRCDVARLDVVPDGSGSSSSLDAHYELAVAPLEGREPDVVRCSVLWSYPGSMTRNRIVDYPGEDDFEGEIRYGMGDDCPYDKLRGADVAILGNGAFAVENVRTCCEYGSSKVCIVTRRKNLACPRVPCWFVHQGPVPVPGRLVLKMFGPMYELCGMGDPWEYYAVAASRDRQHVQVSQASRFGIGDVTFLAVAYGKCEYVEDTLKRLTRHTLHLTSGRKLEGVTVLLKSLGLLGDFAVDRLHRMKKMVGDFCDGDWRRVLHIDDTGMHFSNITTFSTGIGSKGWILTYKFLFDYPKEFFKMRADGYLAALPTHQAEEQYDKPAYVKDAKMKQATGLITAAMNPKLAQLNSMDGEYKYRMYHVSHPTDKILEECVASWNEYQEAWKKQGSTHDYIPYPYTRQMIDGYFREYSEGAGFPVLPDPPSDLPELRAPSSEIGRPPPGFHTEQAAAAAQHVVDSEHFAWWSAPQVSSPYNLFRRQQLRDEDEYVAAKLPADGPLAVAAAA